jgi:hypothetical protein
MPLKISKHHRVDMLSAAGAQFAPKLLTNLACQRLSIATMTMLVRSRQVDFRSVVNGFAAEKIACQSFVY